MVPSLIDPPLLDPVALGVLSIRTTALALETLPASKSGSGLWSKSPEGVKRAHPAPNCAYLPDPRDGVSWTVVT
jgi:hypothetical protein